MALLCVPILVTDLVGRQLGAVSSFQTTRDVDVLIQELARRIKQILTDYNACEGVGVSVPGMVEPTKGRVVHAPTLAWHDVNLRDPLAAALGIPVQIENSGKACALAQLWADVAQTPKKKVTAKTFATAYRKRFKADLAKLVREAEQTPIPAAPQVAPKS